MFFHGLVPIHKRRFATATNPTSIDFASLPAGYTNGKRMVALGILFLSFRSKAGANRQLDCEQNSLGQSIRQGTQYAVRNIEPLDPCRDKEEASSRRGRFYDARSRSRWPPCSP